MKKRHLFIMSSVLMISAALFLSCGGSKGGDDSAPESSSDSSDTGILGQEKEIPMTTVDLGDKTYKVADISDESHIYKDNVAKSNCLIVISKREFRLYVYECDVDTLLAASFPICYAINPEAKRKAGDNRTPESSMSSPFTISQIQPASDWCHDFGDGRGELKAYGDWFIRLNTGFNGIGIHGSTNNEASIPGRDSEGCIRLRDNDLIKFHDLFAEVGQKVIIKSVDAQKLPFELSAEKALGEKYVAPTPGYKLPGSEGDESVSDETTAVPTSGSESEEGEVG